jgi:hypothetical protein
LPQKAAAARRKPDLQAEGREHLFYTGFITTAPPPVTQRSGYKVCFKRAVQRNCRSGAGYERQWREAQPQLYGAARPEPELRNILRRDDTEFKNCISKDITDNSASGNFSYEPPLLKPDTLYYYKAFI